MDKIDTVAILDCGGQYTKVIDRKVREARVRSDIFPLGISASKLKEHSGIIISGGPESVWSDTSLSYDKDIFGLGVPILGICYGLHLINTHFGGTVRPGVKNEYGETEIEIDADCTLFRGCGDRETVLMSHGDSVERLAPGFRAVGVSGHIVAAMYSEARKTYGVQFHPEVDLTVNGKKMLANFLYSECGLSGNYKLEDRIDTAIRKIREKAGKNKVLVLVSGGVDSAVSAALLLSALDSDQVIGVHIDHGFMRKNESDLICGNLVKLGFKKLVRVDASDFFYDTSYSVNGKTMGPLKETIDPEAKRNIIGRLFIETLKSETRKLGLDFDKTFIAQGTLRPDLIESGNPDVSMYAHKIKTHHNDVEIVREAREKGLVIETNWDWHKDEVRQVARTLGIDEAIAARQPFPGPGLAIRCICSDAAATIADSEQSAFNEFIARAGSDYNGAVLPISTVGVQGDCRSYRYLAVLAQRVKALDSESIYRIGTLVPSSLGFINRVALVLNGKNKPDEIRTFPMNLAPENIGLLRDLDALVREYLENRMVSQVFAVLLPIGITKKRSVAIRAFVTNDFMTGRPAIIGKEITAESITRLTEKIEDEFEDIDLVLYDITSKPPATVEWE